jgi:hypothetical protein
MIIFFLGVILHNIFLFYLIFFVCVAIFIFVWLNKILITHIIRLNILIYIYPLIFLFLI